MQLKLRQVFINPNISDYPFFITSSTKYGTYTLKYIEYEGNSEYTYETWNNLEDLKNHMIQKGIIFLADSPKDYYAGNVVNNPISPEPQTGQIYEVGNSGEYRLLAWADGLYYMIDVYNCVQTHYSYSDINSLVNDKTCDYKFVANNLEEFFKQKLAD